MFDKICFIYSLIVFLVIFPNRSDSMMSNKDNDLLEATHFNRGLCGNRFTVPALIYDKCFAPFNKKRGNRIEGGIPGRDEYDWPWFALLDLRRYHPFGGRCGGVIITDRYILTTAYCLEYENIGPPIEKKDYHKVKVQTFGKYPQTFDVEWVHFPDKRRTNRWYWGYKDVYNWKKNLALVKTNKPMNSFGLTNVCLSTNEIKPFGKKISFIGKGNIGGSGQSNYTDILHETSFIGTKCVQSYRFNCSDWDCFCLSSTAEWQSDEGGPAMVQGYNKKYHTIQYHLVAIMIGWTENQIVFLNIWPFINWIKEKTAHQNKYNP